MPQTRTYPFDMVFGPEADQALIYQEVVAPMLDEVIQGYNCTLFAYGQTGTGKTHTMQGDLMPTALGNPSAQAGMIPRVLFKLFHYLEHSVSDFSVKVSYIELYNEELRDLLAPDTSSPEQLKIFDDAQKRGVFIQGLEEVGVSNAKEALAILTKGSERRAIAATKFNEHSSRSHAVFTLTVHSRESASTGTGDDVLRIGKMNLVDLAGSENIGRSGAKDGRAREAGMINQSLLTLGRVINALVDHASHVPYRESKLTRLLQDSLGGRTKTCIVATVSPARNNVEETLSTLDYALRAKSIANRPELNARMTRNALLKEYVSEIERLKADVLAARERNGIFLSEERWDAIEREREGVTQEREEARRQVEIAESQLRNVREEFEQSMEVLMRKESELGAVKEKLSKREEELKETEGMLRTTQNKLDEEVVIRQAFEANEEVLDEVAGGLKKVVGESLHDVGGLFDKIDRKANVFSSNSKAVYSQSKAINAEITALSSAVDALLQLSSQHVSRSRNETEHLQRTEIASLTALADKCTSQLLIAQEAIGKVQAKEANTDDATASIAEAVNSALEDLRGGISSWVRGVQEKWESAWVDIEAEVSSAFTEAEKAVKTLASSSETALREAQGFAEAQRVLAAEARAATEDTMATELARLKSQNIALARALETERAKSERAQVDLAARITSLVSDFMREREDSVRETFAEVEQSNVSASSSLSSYQAREITRMDDGMKHLKHWNASLEKNVSELKRTRDGTFKTIAASANNVENGLANIRVDIEGATSRLADDMSERAQILEASYLEASERMSRAKRARVDATNTLTAEAQSTYRHVQQTLASSTRGIGGSVAKLSTTNTELQSAMESFHSTGVSHLSAAREAIQALVEQGTREDVPTGITPRKRRWEFTDTWERTKPREAILREHRQRSGLGKSTMSIPGSSDSVESFGTEQPPAYEEEAPFEPDNLEIQDIPDVQDMEKDVQPEIVPVSDDEATPASEEESVRVKENEVPVISIPVRPSLPIPTKSVQTRSGSIASKVPAPLKRGASGLPKSTSALAERHSIVPPLNRRRVR